jgi:hypothetical protein
LNVDEAVFVGIDERAKKDAAHEAEDRGVGADAEGKGSDNRESQAFGAAERAYGDSQILE